jgi:hypothetical protein
MTRVKRLAWAATIMLAVAVGWYARGTVFPGQAERTMAPQRSAVASQPEEGAASGERGAESGEQEAERRQLQSQLAAAPTLATELDEAAQQRDRDMAGGGAMAKAETQPDTQPTEVVAAAPPRAKAEADVELKGEIVDVSRDRAARADTPARRALEAPRVVTQQVAAEEPLNVVGGVTIGEVLVLEDSMWMEATDAEAREVLGGDVPVVEGLPVVDYWVSPLRGRDVVRVRQQLDNDRLLELSISRVVAADRIQTGVVGEVAADVPEDAAATTMQSIMLHVDDYEVVLRAAVSRDSLQVLGSKIRLACRVRLLSPSLLTLLIRGGMGGLGQSIAEL